MRKLPLSERVWKEAWPPFAGIAGLAFVAFGILLATSDDLLLGVALVLAGIALLAIYIRATKIADSPESDQSQREPQSPADIAARVRAERDERRSGP